MPGASCLRTDGFDRISQFECIHMLNHLLITIVKILLRLRYRIRLHGAREIARAGNRPILFLPNHPALIDPIIVMAYLYRPFRPRALADEVQIDRFFIRRLACRLGVMPIPDIGRSGSLVTDQVRAMLDQCVATLHHRHLLLYPAGRVYRQHLEDLRGNSAVHRIIQQLPDVRIVLVRTRGLWGSSFSWATGKEPSLSRALKSGLKSLLLSGIFFAPRREVNIELIEPTDFPRPADRNTINKYLEAFYNEDALPNTFVPPTIWQPRTSRRLPEPPGIDIQGDPSLIPPATRSLVRACLAQLTGIDDFTDTASLSQDLGVDSLSAADLLLWLQSEFGFAPIDVGSIRTVADVMLAACGQAVSTRASALKEVPASWFHHPAPPLRPDHLPEMTITNAFLHQARRSPRAVIIADQIAGPRTYRDLILAILILRPHLAALPGPYLGIMMPASLAANILYLAALFAGKTPVMVNWTLGPKNLLHCLDSLNVQHILTSAQLLEQLKSQGIDLSAISPRLICLEDLRRRLTRREKLTAYLRSRFNWSTLNQTQPSPTAVVLFTSGSEDVPKAVPLTHQNLLTNISDAFECFAVTSRDSMLGMLPPFHAFGLTVSILLPLTLGLRCVYYPNPTHGRVLGQMIDAYQVTMLVGTPTFLNGIVRTSTSAQLTPLRLVVSGAEKCPQRVYDLLSRHCPQTEVLEGYGVTECSPVISVNHQDDSHPGTIGKVMSSLEYVLVDENTHQPVATDQNGMLLVRGPSVFPGYLNYDGPSPFTTFENKSWYRTGDLIAQDSLHTLTFKGRLKRFIKLGGEMISLPAIEAVLEPHYTSEDDEGPVLAVTSTPNDEHPEIVLFTTKQIDRAETNAHLRTAGLSPLHNIRQIIQIDTLPLLGTGKTDYRTLTEKLGGIES